LSFLSIIDLGETAEDDQPAFTHNGDLIPLPGERILMVASFPSIGLIHSRSDDGWYKMDKVTFPGEGGETIVTDQRLVVAQQKYDVGKHGKSSSLLFPLTGGAVRAVSRSRAKRRRKRTILAGQINLSDIRLLTYRSDKPALGPEFHWLQFVAPSDSVFVGIELHSKAIADNRGAGIAAAVAAAHGLGSANADRRTPNTITWEFQGPGVGAPAPAEQKVAGTTSSPVVTTVTESRACPWCAHLVDSASIVCAYCERSIEAETKPPSRSATVPTGHVGGTTERYRSCPWCAETISAGALECPICEKNLRPAPGLASATEPRTDSVSEVREPQVPRDETGPIGAAPPVTRTEAPLNRDGSLGANDDRNRAHETAGGASATIQTRKWQLVAAVAVVAAGVVLGASFFRTPETPPPTTTLATAQDTGTSTTQSTSTTEETTTTQIAISDTPQITSISTVVANADQQIQITGSGFGNYKPFDGNLPCFEILVVGKDPPSAWFAGHVDPTSPGPSGKLFDSCDAPTVQRGSLVKVKFIEWTDSRILIAGLKEIPCCSYSINSGDTIRFLIANANSGKGPASFDTVAA